MTQSLNPSEASRRRLSQAFFLAAFVGLCLLMLRILAPFLPTFAAAVLLGIILAPLHSRVLRAVRGRRNVAAALSTLMVFVGIVIPLGLGAWFLMVRTVDALPHVQDWVQRHVAVEGGEVQLSLPAHLQSAVDRVHALLAEWNLEPAQLAADGLKQVGPLLAAFGAKALKALPGALFSVVVLLFATFFIFRDGAKIYQWFLTVLPMEREHAEKIFGRLDDTLVAIVRGALITALVQGLVAAVGFVIAGAPFALLLGCAATLLAFIPLVGTTLVWLPTGIYLIAVGRVGAGVFLLLWGLLVVGLVDNFLRPKLIGDRANLPIFALFFCTLGGIAVFGPTGALVGPIALTAFMAFAAIFVEQWRGQAGAQAPPAAAPPAPEPPPPQSTTQDSA